MRQLADRLRSSSRNVDVLARYGGEEFALLLPEVEMSKAKQMAERLRKDVEKEPFETEKGPIPITISIGICDVSVKGHRSGLDILKMADEALYKAKEGGRNQTRVFGG